MKWLAFGAVLFSLIAAIAGIASAQTTAPIDDDERANWQAIGRVNIGGYRSRSICTGTLIAPDTVLTAAHCVTDPKSDAPYTTNRVHFVAGWHRGEHRGTSSAQKIELHPDYNTSDLDSGKSLGAENIGTDLALITLTSPLNGSQPAAVALDGDEDDPIAVLGYRRDRPHILSKYDGCNSTEKNGNIVILGCDVGAGTSGAPVFGERDGKWHVIGVVSARSSAANGPQALAARVDRTRLLEFRTSDG